MSTGGASEEYFLPDHFKRFKQAARLFRVYIAVRRINKKSLEYAGKTGYTPKLLDCKAKTADLDVIINGRPRKTAGLVVDYEVFRSKGLHTDVFKPDKLKDAEDSWNKFVMGGKIAPPSIYGEDGKSISTTAIGYTYFTQLEPDHEHFGCLRWSPIAQARGGKYIHGDYDLYGVAPEENPHINEFVSGKGEERLGMPHSRSPHQLDVSIYITSLIPGMVSHGEQDTFKNDTDDELDVFYPDGHHVEALLGSAAITDFYKSVLGGRPIFSSSSEIVPSPRGGEWKMIKA